MEAAPTSARIGLAALTEFVTALFTAVGMRGGDAATLARSLLAAEATGVGTHGLSRVGPYVAQLESGQVNPCPTERVLTEGPGSLLLDADCGFGAPVGLRAVDAAIDKAKQVGLALAGVTRVAHFGAAGFYTRYAADYGCLALAMSNSSPSVVPFGANGPRIGNSPMSFASPGTQRPELVLDMAQSMASRGRVKQARDAATPIPAGWALDASGNPTTDPAAALAGGILPSGGHKGSALSLMVEMLAAGLTGANPTRDVTLSGFTGGANSTSNSAIDVTVGNLYLVIDAGIFGDAAGSRERATAIADYVRASEPASGVAGVRAPGDVEDQQYRRCCTEGVVVGARTWQELCALAARFDVCPPTTARTQPGDNHGDV